MPIDLVLQSSKIKSGHVPLGCSYNSSSLCLVIRDVGRDRNPNREALQLLITNNPCYKPTVQHAFCMLLHSKSWSMTDRQVQSAGYGPSFYDGWPSGSSGQRSLIMSLQSLARRCWRGFPRCLDGEDAWCSRLLTTKGLSTSYNAYLFSDMSLYKWNVRRKQWNAIWQSRPLISSIRLAEDMRIGWGSDRRRVPIALVW